MGSLSILEYESGGQIVNLLPFVGVTNQSERVVWSVPEVSRFQVMVTADLYSMERHTSRDISIPFLLTASVSRTTGT